MASEKKNATGNECDSTSKPLFTGDYMRDSSVTEYEKATEASNAIFNAIMRKTEKKKGI